MIEIKKYNQFQEFLGYNQEEILNNYFIYFHLIKTIESLDNQRFSLYDAYNIKDDNNNSIICLWSTGTYSIYTNNWTDRMLDALLEEINVNRFNNFTFMGERGIVLSMLKKASVVFEVTKDRIVYRCAETLPIKREINGIVENASLIDFEELVLMSNNYYQEEYNGEGQRTISQIAESVKNGIETSNLFVLKIEDKICSIVQVISKDRDKPYIGNLYTKPEFRNQGFAYQLLHTVTEGLISVGYEQCGLVSDATNPATNKIFKEIGYQPIYKLVLAFKE